MTLVVRTALFSLTAAGGLLAQSVISARSGLIHYVEGRVLMAGNPVEVKFGSYPEVKEGAELKTEEGRAEVLLNPGVFLRLGENSAIRMITARLTDTRIEFLSGSIVIESDEMLKEKGNTVAIVHGDATVELRKTGIYRFDSQPAQLRVYAGEADMKSGNNILVIKQGRQVSLTGALVPEKFDASMGDSLTRWSKRRAESIAIANISAAKYIRDSSMTWSTGGWYYNPYFGMFTFIPGGGSYMSPYGYRYYGPRDVYRVYERPVLSAAGFDSNPRWNSSVGYNTVGPSSSGYSGATAVSQGVSSAPNTTSSGAASAPVSRGGGEGGGRDR